MTTEDPSFSTLKSSFFLPSLEDLSLLAAVKASMLHDDVKKILNQHFHRSDSLYLPRAKACKLTDICKSQFQIPQIFEKKILSTVRCVRDQYCKWLKFILRSSINKKDFGSQRDLLNQAIDSVVWDLIGTVDIDLSEYQLLLKADSPEVEKNIFRKFETASKCCLKDDVKILWGKLSIAKKDDILSNRYYNVLTYYWAFVVTDNGEYKQKFLEKVRNCLGGQRYIEVLNIYVSDNYEGDVNNAAFLTSVFFGNFMSVKYFFEKLSCIDLERVVNVYLTHCEFGSYSCGWRNNCEDVKILYFLLTQLNDDLAEKVLNKHFKTILKLSVKYWPWQKFVVPLMKMHLDGIDQVLLFDILCDLTCYVCTGRTDIFLVKNLWRIIPIELKKSFCLFISKQQKNRYVRELWKYMTIEVLNLFMRDDECKTILMPHNNFGFSVLISEKDFDIVNHWLKKCLVTDEAIISFIENFIVNELSERMKYYSLSEMTELLDWCRKYEDGMNKEKILKAKDGVVDLVGVKGFRNGIKMQKWEDLEKFTDWIMKNRDDYDDKLINLKIQALKKILVEQKGAVCWKKKNFTENLVKFFNYGVRNIEKLKIMIKKINLHEGENCEFWLTRKTWRHNPTWEGLNAFLEFLSEYDRDILKVKQNIFKHIFYNKDEELKNFQNVAYSENIKKLIDWNCDDDSLADMNKKIKEARSIVISKYAVNIIVKFVYNDWGYAIINFMNCLFKDGDCAKIVWDLKKNVIDKLLNEDFFWREKNHILRLVVLINYGKDNEYVKKDIWSGKKYFIDKFMENVKKEIIPELILGKEKNFMFSLFENEEDENDFGKTLWEFKKCLLKKLSNDEDYLLMSEVFEGFEELNEFLNWNNSGDGLNDLKILILNGNGVQCCLKWILNDNFEILKVFLKWCVLKESNMADKLLKLKENVFENFLCNYSEIWREDFFPLLDKFLVLKLKEKDLKKDLIKKYEIQGCIKKLCKGDYGSVRNFMNWAYKGENNKSIENFKENLLKEILQCEKIEQWKNLYPKPDDDDIYDFHIALDKFLYEYNNPNNAKIACMKFGLIEIYFDEIFTKLLNGRKTGSRPIMENVIKNFLSWTFDKIIKSSDELLPRINKFKKGILDNFGKQYFIVTIEQYDWESASEFWDLFAPSKTEIKVKDIKSLLWDLKKDCIEQILASNITKCGSIYFNEFWSNLNKFLSFRHTSSKMKDEICEFKELIRQKYGIDIIKNYFSALDEDNFGRYYRPKYFLRWLFGGNGKNSSSNLDDKKLIDFKKEILENLLSIKFEIGLSIDNFYGNLIDILEYNSVDESIIFNMKKSVIKVQGIQLCIDLICKTNIKSLKRFLKWARNILNDDLLNFKKNVVTGLAENLTLEYTWDSLKHFLDYGFNLEKEQDIAKYSELKKHISESCSVDICYNYILKYQWDDVSMFLEWCFDPLDNQRYIELKTRLIEKHGPDYCNARIFDNDWEKLEIFLNWSYKSYRQDNEVEEKIINLKIKTLQNDISYKDHLEIVLRFLEWGFKSKAHLNKFKKDILDKTHPLNYFVRKAKYKSNKTFQLWFSNKK